MNYYIVRNAQKFGPYDIKAIEHYVNAGNILVHDKAIDAASANEITVRQALKIVGIKPQVASNGNVFTEIKKVGWDLLLPKSSYSFKSH